MSKIKLLSNQNLDYIAVDSRYFLVSPFLSQPISHIPFPFNMIESDDDDGSDASSYSHDVFETDNNIEIYEDLLLREGFPSVQLPSRTTWKYNAFTDRGSEYIGDLKKIVAKEDEPFTLRYNTIDRMLFDKAKTEFNRSMMIIEADLKDRGGSSTVTPFTAFASFLLVEKS